MSNFVIKADFAYNKNINEIKTYKDSYLVCEDGVSKGIYKSLPKKYQDLKLYDYSNKLCIPGMIDLHIHAPQYAYRGLYMDEELLDWLNKYAFVEEGKYRNLKYADKAYDIFVNALKKSATTRAAIFGTVHLKATLLLMEKMEKTGLISYVGKVNMNRNAPKYLLDSCEEASIKDSISIIEAAKKYKRTKAIITPRFIPSCSNKLLKELGDLASKYEVPIQSHLSENPGEIENVHQLMPDIEFYGQGYAKYGLFGGNNKTIMAHCVYSSKEEVELMKENGVYIASCPSSNMNVRSGIAPISSYIEKGLNVGLGSDVAGGESESIFGEIKKAIEVSKLYNRLVDNDVKELSFPNAFYLSTIGGGKFFGKVGSFERGYELDAIVLNDEIEPHPQALNIQERLERSVYLGVDKKGIVAKFVKGKKIY